MTRVFLTGLSCFAMSATGAFATGDEPSAGALDCAARLERTLEAMENRPLLKEEHATALMWLRMDAAEADAAGDQAECVERVEQVELLLGLGLN